MSDLPRVVASWHGLSRGCSRIAHAPGSRRGILRGFSRSGRVERSGDGARTEQVRSWNRAYVSPAHATSRKAEHWTRLNAAGGSGINMGTTKELTEIEF